MMVSFYDIVIFPAIRYTKGEQFETLLKDSADRLNIEILLINDGRGTL